jgi:NodT family efflux transporter outer membrane factor (OMF) lipoprotein
MKSHMHVALLLLAVGAGTARPAAAQEGASPAPARPALAAPGGTTAGASPADFWRTLGDPTLERIIDEALSGSQNIEIAGARVSGARAAQHGAVVDLTPSITAVGGYARQRLASTMVPGAPGRLPDASLWDAGLRLSWDLDVFGGLRRSLRGRGALLSAAREDVRDVRIVLAAEVASAYFELRSAQDRLAVARRNADNQRGTLELTLQRLEAGRGTDLDTERARAQLSTTLAAIPALEASIAAAQHRIGVLAGRPPATFAAMLDAAAPPVALPEPPSVERSDALVRQRPDVRSAEQRVAAGAAFVDAARTEYLPRLALDGAAGYTGSTVGSLGDGDTPRYTIGLVVSWPALDLGRVRARLDAARADEAEARARYDQTVLRSVEEVETSLVAYRKARERLEHLDASAAASERAAELARLRYTEGASDFLQVLDAERTLLAAQDQRALGRSDATGALVALFRALAGTDPRETGAPR